jgi:hypothetical protein
MTHGINVIVDVLLRHDYIRWQWEVGHSRNNNLIVESNTSGGCSGEPPNPNPNPSILFALSFHFSSNKNQNNWLTLSATVGTDFRSRSSWCYRKSCRISINQSTWGTRRSRISGDVDSMLWFWDWGRGGRVDWIAERSLSHSDESSIILVASSLNIRGQVCANSIKSGDYWKATSKLADWELDNWRGTTHRRFFDKPFLWLDQQKPLRHALIDNSALYVPMAL